MCQKLQNAYQIPSDKFVSSATVYPEGGRSDYEFEALHHLDIMLLSKVQRHYPFQLAIDFIFHNGMSLRNYRKAIPVSGKKQFEKVIASYSSKESLLACSSWYVKRSMTRKIN